MASTELAVYNARRARKASVGQSQSRTPRLVRQAESSLRIRNDEEDGLEAAKRTLALLNSSITVLSEVYLKIGTHWSPVEGNAATDYGWGWLE